MSVKEVSEAVRAPQVPVSRFRRGCRWAAWVLLGLALLATVGWVELSRSREAAMLERRGRLADARLEAAETAAGLVLESWRLVSSSGLACELTLRRPVAAGARPLVLLLGGHRTGRDAVRLVPEDERLVVAAISYPYKGPERLKGLAVAPALPAIRQALLDTPPCLSLALDHLLGPSFGGLVDPRRIELVGVSLGAPLVCAAGALDPRFSRVWAIHGGGDIPGLIAHNLPEKLRVGGLHRPLAAFGGLLVAPLSPDRFAGRISPRPFVMLNAEDDEKIPRANVEALFASARHPKELSWMPGRHVDPGRQEIVQELLAAILPRILAGEVKDLEGS